MSLRVSGTTEEDTRSKILGKKVTLYDPYSMKDAIDEEVASNLDTYEIVESNTLVHIKILLGFVSWVLGYYSYFKLDKLPKSLNISIACVAAYIVISVMYTYIENYIEKDCFLEYVSSKFNTLKDFEKVRFCSTIEEYSEFYHFAIEGKKKGDEMKRIEINKSFGEFFDSEGYLHKDKVKELFNDGVKLLISKKN